MEFVINWVEFVFGAALFINAILFIPQIIQLLKSKTAKGISLTTFLGFLLIQIAVILHGIVNQDYVLIFGYLFSTLTCGTVVGLIFFYKAANGKLADENIELEEILKQLPGHVYWVNKENVYLGCNDQQAKSAGLNSREEIIGKRNADLPWNVNAGELSEALDKINMEVIQTGKAITLEELASLKKDGSEMMLLSNKTPIRNAQGEIMGMVGISIDITDKRRQLILEKNKAESANRAKMEFLQDMRHDIRTPITGIIGCAELINSSKNDPSKVAEYSSVLIKSSNALLSLMNDVLDSIQATSGEIQLLKKKFDLKLILEKVIELNQSKAYQKKLPLTLQYDPLIPKYLIGDSKRLYRIVLELITNALKYTHQGSVTVTAKLAKNENRNVIVKIAVQDTGIGIPDDQKQEIFTRFTRLHPASQGIYPGTGLGLAIIKQFLEDLQAEIYVESGINKGSTFTCIIPFSEALLSEDFGTDSEVSTQ